MDDRTAAGEYEWMNRLVSTCNAALVRGNSQAGTEIFVA